MSDAFCLWCKCFTSRSLVSQNHMHVISNKKNHSPNTPETDTEKRALPETNTIFYIEMPSVCGVSVAQADHWSPKTYARRLRRK